jgi:hypothetical protein
LETLSPRRVFRKERKTIILDWSIPSFLPKKTNAITIGEVEFNLLSHQKYTWHQTSKKTNKSTAWLVTVPYDSTDVNIQRVKYEVFERPDYSRYSTPPDPVKEYLIYQVSDVAIEDRKAVAEKMEGKYKSKHNLKYKIKNKLVNILVTKRLREENRENLAAMFLRNICAGHDKKGNAVNFEDKKDQDIFNIIFGPEGITNYDEVPREPLAEKLFLFILASGIEWNYLPDIDDSEQEWSNTEGSIQWKFLQITRDEYIMMYREILSATVKEVIAEEPAKEEADPDIGSGDEAEETESDLAEAE